MVIISGLQEGCCLWSRIRIVSFEDYESDCIRQILIYRYIYFIIYTVVFFV